MSLNTIVADIVRRIPAMAQDSPVNNERLLLNLLQPVEPPVPVTVEDFRPEMAVATKAFDLFVITMEKSNDEFVKALESLMAKAVREYNILPPGKAHGIGLDRDVSIILSRRRDNPRPFCNIYFNLHSDYFQKMRKK